MVKTKFFPKHVSAKLSTPKKSDWKGSLPFMERSVQK